MTEERKNTVFDPTTPIKVLGVDTTIGKLVEAVNNSGSLPQSKIRDLLEGRKPFVPYEGNTDYHEGTPYPAPEEEGF